MQIPMVIIAHLFVRIRSLQIPQIEHVKQTVRLCFNITSDVYFIVHQGCSLTIIIIALGQRAARVENMEITQQLNVLVHARLGHTQMMSQDFV
jgi:hypothetical protein